MKSKEAQMIQITATDFAGINGINGIFIF